MAPMRADARRNYDRLLDAAREAVDERGFDASLDDIAKRAGVGSGTLYRHFPSRMALMEAVFISRIEDLSVHTYELAENAEPEEALESWMTSLLDYVNGNRGLGVALKSALDNDGHFMERCHQLMRDSADAVVIRAQRAGVLRLDVTSTDLMRLVGGVAQVTEALPDRVEQGRRLLTVVIDGLQPHHAPPDDEAQPQHAAPDEAQNVP
jgi:AcrR family transcriptional regulator